MIAYLAGLPPVRLHDLRHGAVTMLLAAGHGMKVVQEALGLSSITIAGDTYTSVLPQLARQSAEDVAALVRPSQVPSPRRRTRQRTRPEQGTSAARRKAA
jgi:integrase